MNRKEIRFSVRLAIIDFNQINFIKLNDSFNLLVEFSFKNVVDSLQSMLKC